MTKGWKKGVKHNGGAENPNAKLTPEMVQAMREIYKNRQGEVEKNHPASIGSIAEKFGVTYSHAWRVVSGKAWRHSG